MAKYNNCRENCNHYKGRIWLNGSIGTRGNICAEIKGREDFMVIAYVPMITDDLIIRSIEAMGWTPDDWINE